MIWTKQRENTEPTLTHMRGAWVVFFVALCVFVDKSEAFLQVQISANFFPDTTFGDLSTN